MTRTSARPAAPPTTPPAMVPAGADPSSLSPESSGVAVELTTPSEVAVAPSPAAPAMPTPLGSSEELCVDDGVAVEKTVDRTVDPSLEIVVTDPLCLDEDPCVLDPREDEGDMVAVWPSESVVVKDSSERVKVSTSPPERVARKRAARSTDELESVVREPLREVAEARLMM